MYLRGNLIGTDDDNDNDDDDDVDDDDDDDDDDGRQTTHLNLSFSLEDNFAYEPP